MAILFRASFEDELGRISNEASEVLRGGRAAVM
jgi:hypothetical protein